ncbi:hypothetical protein [Desulfitobacterium sp.]|uniref:hypothetical protein n=1 Tax=Desulfitobacterium sp. TaxID=49981 RepID=UPI002BF05205|nr:hypothetical protein [Desulfitobacterium sp.]HVJ50209.1 hypothetical protein [Desulfitobacterium sp.]
MIFLYVILLFIIIYLAVRLAINPLIPKTTELEIDENDVSLVKLRDIEVLTNTELEEVIELFHSKSVKNEDRRQYENYSKVLNELRESGFFTLEEYAKRMEKLNNYFNKR